MNVYSPSAFLLSAGLILGVSGCAQTRPYTKPTMDLPAHFKEASLWQAARAQTAPVPDEWWRVFNDPQLEQLQAQAALGNQNLKNSTAQFQAARAALGGSQAALSPAVGVNAGAPRGNGSSTAAPVVQGYSVGANASWELDIWGRLSGGVDASQAKLQASLDDLAAARLSLQATLAQTYFSLKTAEAQASLLDSTVAAYLRSLSMTQNRYAAGMASAADVAQAQTQWQSAKAQLIEIQLSRSQLEHALAVLVGQAPAGFSLLAAGAATLVPAVPVQLPSTLIERRPDIAAAEQRVAAAYAQMGVAKAAFFPSLTLSGSASYKSTTLADVFSAPNLLWSLGPSLAFSVFDGGANKAAEQSAQANADQAVAVYRQSVLTALQEVEDNLVIAASLEREEAVQAAALVSAKKVLEVTMNQYQSGIVSYLNVTSAQATALSLENGWLVVRNRRILAVVQLLKNLGGRWDKTNL